ncbi:MAG TPA: hypothetical protein VK641_03160 [Terriglobales bacterium]|jgi:hypothetical protein|nr:hypothetical protein [Terriglobales bacterium]
MADELQAGRGETAPAKAMTQNMPINPALLIVPAKRLKLDNNSEPMP